tara:strand:- start:84 stop:848 length:765 start_codon:yes stop_codon:yes gene_type:complete
MSSQNDMLKKDILDVLSKQMSGGGDTREAYQSSNVPKTKFGLGGAKKPKKPTKKEREKENEKLIQEQKALFLTGKKPANPEVKRPDRKKLREQEETDYKNAEKDEKIFLKLLKDNKDVLDKPLYDNYFDNIGNIRRMYAFRPNTERLRADIKKAKSKAKPAKKPAKALTLTKADGSVIVLKKRVKKAPNKPSVPKVAKKARKPRKLTLKGRKSAEEKLDIAHQKAMDKTPFNKTEHDRVLNDGYKALIKKYKKI